MSTRICTVLKNFPTKIVQNQVSIQSWGLHMTVDASRCNKKAIRSSTTIEKFTKDLVSKIHMKAYGDPQIVMFGDGDKKGYTLVQLIETSNITAHFCEESDNMYFDLFSCKHFSQHDVEHVLHSYFQPLRMVSRITKRDASLLV